IGTSTVSGITVLSNGNYVVYSLLWNDSRGAATWGSGTAGIAGTISAANSLIGTNPNDRVGFAGVTALANGHYVVRRSWGKGDRGAVTWGNGMAGVSGPVSASNSLVGSDPSDSVGGFGIVVLDNGNYVVHTARWNGFRGAVTWGSGTAG